MSLKINSTKKEEKPKKQAPEENSLISYGTGRRKNAVARVWVKPGTGQIIVNKKSIDEYFCRDFHRRTIIKPFAATKSLGKYDVYSTITGGGHSGQAGALLHGIARALDKLVPEFHPALRSNGYLTRDSRVVERKKYGKRKARKSTQFSKR